MKSVCVCVCVSVCGHPATLNVSESVKWLKLNYKSTGFYMVDYGTQGWADLIQALTTNLTVLPSEDRASLIHNMFALSRYTHTHTRTHTQRLVHHHCILFHCPLYILELYSIYI